MSRITIKALQVFTLTRGKVYILELPQGTTPAPGQVVRKGIDEWKITGVRISGTPADRDGVWDCMLVQTTPGTGDLSLGEHVVDLI